MQELAASKNMSPAVSTNGKESLYDIVNVLYK